MFQIVRLEKCDAWLPPGNTKMLNKFLCFGSLPDGGFLGPASSFSDHAECRDPVNIVTCFFSGGYFH